MSPSAPLSNSAHALISLPLTLPTSLTLIAIKGDLIFRMTSGGTGSESSVSKMAKRFMKAEQGKRMVPTDSAAVEPLKNPGELTWVSGACACLHHTRCTGWILGEVLPRAGLLRPLGLWCCVLGEWLLAADWCYLGFVGCWKRALALMSLHDIHVQSGLLCHNINIVCS